jgi:competence protein ComER
MHIGIIGTGNMGGMLAIAFAKLDGNHVYLFNRTKSKAESLAAEYTRMTVCATPAHLIHKSNIVLLCTKPEDGRQILKHLGGEFTDNQILLASISSIPLIEIERYTNAKVGKIIPSLTQCVNKGVILLTFGSRFSRQDKTQMESCFAKIAKPVTISESQMRVSADITSCGPAFLSHIAALWAKAASEYSNVSYEMAESMVTQTLIGFTSMLEQGMTLEDIKNKIMVPGGVTERGMAGIGNTPYRMFKDLHNATHMVTHSQKP